MKKTTQILMAAAVCECIATPIHAQDPTVKLIHCDM